MAKAFPIAAVLGALILLGFIFLSTTSPLRSLAVLPSGDPSGYAHQFTYELLTRSVHPCQPEVGCDIIAPSHEPLLSSGNVKFSFTSKVSGKAPCRVQTRDADTGDLVEKDLDCPDSIILHNSYGSDLEFKPGQTIQLNDLWNVTYVPTFGYETVGSIALGTTINPKSPVVNGVYTYISSATYNFLIGFDVDRAIRLGVHPTNVLILPFKQDASLKGTFSLASPQAAGLSVGVVGVDRSDTLFEGTTPKLQEFGSTGSAREVDVNVPTQDIGLRVLDLFPMMKADVFGSNPHTVRLHTIRGIRYVYDVLPSGADTSSSRSRVAEIISDPGSDTVIGEAPIGANVGQGNLLPEPLPANGPSFFDSIKTATPLELGLGIAALAGLAWFFL